MVRHPVTILACLDHSAEVQLTTALQFVVRSASHRALQFTPVRLRGPRLFRAGGWHGCVAGRGAMLPLAGPGGGKAATPLPRWNRDCAGSHPWPKQSKLLRSDRHCSASVVVLTGNWFPVGYRRGERSIPVKPLPVAAQAQKEPKSCASANFATSANL
jgi:hypothetical protein